VEGNGHGKVPVEVWKATSTSVRIDDPRAVIRILNSQGITIMTFYSMMYKRILFLQALCKSIRIL
jgi:hypothetical protein